MMEQILSRSKTNNFNLIKKHNPEIYEILYEQFILILKQNWANYSIEHIPNKCIFITWVYKSKDLCLLKESYEMGDFNIECPSSFKFIDAITPLVVSFLILHQKNDFSCFKYNCSINYVELMGSSITGIGCGSKMLQRVQRLKQKDILPLHIIPNSKGYWFKILYKKFKFTTSNSLIKINKNLMLSYELNWKYLYKLIDEKCKVVASKVATDFVTDIFKLTNIAFNSII